MSGTCCGKKVKVIEENLRRIAIVGSPNVGKSVLFNRLTGSYVTVSNYPGTTVEVSRGRAKIGEEEFEVIDTPGIYSLLPITEEERITRRLLMTERPGIVIHIIDAKNLERMLSLTLQLIEAGLPVILVLNIIDEAEKIGMKINLQHIEKELNIPIVATVSTTGRGIDILKKKIVAYQHEGKKIINDEEDDGVISIETALKRQNEVNTIVKGAVEYIPQAKLSFKERLSLLMISPLTGIPILLVILYYGLYKFVDNTAYYLYYSVASIKGPVCWRVWRHNTGGEICGCPYTTHSNDILYRICDYRGYRLLTAVGPADRQNI